MPSDQRLERILEALERPIHSFRSVLATTVEQVRGGLQTHRSGGNNGRRSAMSAELGDFADGRIDPERFELFLANRPSLDQVARDRIESATATLLELAARKDRLFWFELEHGARLRDEVAHALSEVGRAFKAARVIELSRSGRYGADGANPLLGEFRFESWNRAERRLVPPQIVFLRGADLCPEALAEFMDGSIKIVLVVEGACAPAPLVRLISPSTYVLQCTGEEHALRAFAEWDGPGVAAVLPEGAARFVHDPQAGERIWDRVRVDALPEQEPLEALGGRSVEQQVEELLQLEALADKPAPAAAPPAAALPSAPVAAAEPVTPADPVDKLASWLLNQADLKGL